MHRVVENHITIYGFLCAVTMALGGETMTPCVFAVET